MIAFNKITTPDNTLSYMSAVLNTGSICGDGQFTKKCQTWLEDRIAGTKVLMTSSCTHSLEMSALLCDIKPGDEVIMPSFTFVSTANAFVLRGATIVFVDIRPDTMNIDEELIEDAITKKTKAIVPVHYAGVSCEMDRIMEIAEKHNLIVIEDAAQGVMASYKSKPLGSIGHLGTYSFHETKNYSSGEGGATLINDPRYLEQAEILREKGTNRSLFLRGQVDKYTWVDVGSSYLASDISMAYLYSQLEMADVINENRLAIWNSYYERLKDLENTGRIILPTVPDDCKHNAHMFYIKAADLEERTKLIAFLRENEIQAPFHYVPLHSAPAGSDYSRFHGTDCFTTMESERLLRLPMYNGLSGSQIENVTGTIHRYFSS